MANVFTGISTLNRVDNVELIEILRRLLRSSLSTIYYQADTAEAGITAYTAGGQSGATQLSTVRCRVDIVAAANASVKPLISAFVGFRQYIYNNGANDLDYYPFLGNNILGQAVNTPFTIAAGNQLAVYCFTKGELTII